MGTVYSSLRDKRVLVTGGASGIGAALVEAFVMQGARVAFVDLDEPSGLELADRLSPSPIFRSLDLKDLAALALCLDGIQDSLGGVDILVNNAANDDRHSPEEVSPAYWDERIATNLRHVFFAVQHVVRGMRERQDGAIINLGSISWHRGLAGLALYETAKAGIEGMTRALAREFGSDGIRVNTIVPGNVDTPRQRLWYSAEGEAEILASQCLKRRVEPVDVAALALFLASDDARMCTGHEYYVDGGWL